MEKMSAVTCLSSIGVVDFIWTPKISCQHRSCTPTWHSNISSYSLLSAFVKAEQLLYNFTPRLKELSTIFPLNYKVNQYQSASFSCKSMEDISIDLYHINIPHYLINGGIIEHIHPN